MVALQQNFKKFHILTHSFTGFCLYIHKYFGFINSQSSQFSSRQRLPCGRFVLITHKEGGKRGNKAEII